MTRFRSIVCLGLASTAVLLPHADARARAAAGAQPSGRLLFATSGDGVSGRLEIATVAPTGGDPVRVTRLKPSGFSPRWTPNGRSIVFATYDSMTDNGAYWRMRSGGTRLERLPGDLYAAPSPSGRLVAELGSRGVELSTANGRRVRTLRLALGEADFYDGDIVWSRDERLLAVNIASESADYVRVFVLRVDGRAPAHTISPKIEGRYEYALSWSPDGRTLAVDTGNSIDYTTITLVRHDGRGRRVLIADAAASGAHSWAPDGSQLAYVGRKGDIFAIRIANRQTRRLARTRSLGEEVGNIRIAWSPAGREVAFSDVGGIYLARASMAQGRRVTRRGAWSDLDWSPDGGRLAFSESHEIFVIRANGTGLRRITQALQDDSPVPSPDGSRVAFVRGARGLHDADRIHVYVMGPDGSGLRRVSRGYGPRWAPDGRRLAFVDVLPDDPPEMNKLRAGRIMVEDVVTRTMQQVAVGTAPTWSPNGLQLAYMRHTFRVRDTWRGIIASETGSSLWVVSSDGSGSRKVLASAGSSEDGAAQYYRRPLWSPDGRWIALVGSQVTLVDPETGEIRTLAVEADEVAWSPDGRQLLAGLSYPDVLKVVDVGTGDVRTVAGERESFEHRFPVWSPDGAHLGFVGCDKRDDFPSCDVYIAAADGTGRRRITRTPGVEGALAWSR